MEEWEPTQRERTNAARVARQMAKRLEAIAERIEREANVVDDIKLAMRVRAVLNDNPLAEDTVARALVLEALHRAQLAFERVNTTGNRPPLPLAPDHLAVMLAVAMYAGSSTSAKQVPLEPELWAELMSAWLRRRGAPTKAERGLRGDDGKLEILAALINENLDGVDDITAEGLKTEWRRWQKTPDHFRVPRVRKQGARRDPQHNGSRGDSG